MVLTFERSEHSAFDSLFVPKNSNAEVDMLIMMFLTVEKVIRNNCISDEKNTCDNKGSEFY